jgi:hypothetical protein
MNLGMQSAANITRGATEGDPLPAMRHVVNLHPLRIQPRDKSRYVRVAGPETIRELLRSEPVVIVERRPVLLIGKKTIQIGLLSRTWF